MQGNRKIEVFLGRPRAGDSPTFATVPPIVHVHIGCDPDWPDNGAMLPKTNGVTYTALIDTGAEATVIKPSIAAQIGAVPVGEAITASGFGGADRVSVVRAQIYFPRANVVFPAQAALVDYPGHTFDAVLGRSFLQNCKLCVNGPDGVYSLTWIGKRDIGGPQTRGLRLPG